MLLQLWLLAKTLCLTSATGLSVISICLKLEILRLILTLSWGSLCHAKLTFSWHLLITIRVWAWSGMHVWCVSENSMLTFPKHEDTDAFMHVVLLERFLQLLPICVLMRWASACAHWWSECTLTPASVTNLGYTMLAIPLEIYWHFLGEKFQKIYLENRSSWEIYWTCLEKSTDNMKICVRFGESKGNLLKSSREFYGNWLKEIYWRLGGIVYPWLSVTHTSPLISNSYSLLLLLLGTGHFWLIWLMLQLLPLPLGSWKEVRPAREENIHCSLNWGGSIHWDQWAGAKHDLLSTACIVICKEQGKRDKPRPTGCSYDPTLSKLPTQNFKLLSVTCLASS